MKKIVLSLFCATLLFGSSLSSIENEQNSKEFKKLFELAKSGDVDSQTLLGEIYLDGLGVKADLDKAFFWLSKASNNEDPQAAYLLGFMYENGIKVSKNLDRAFTLYTKAAKGGDIMAKYHLAFMYKDGKGVEKDRKKAISLLKEIKDIRDRDILAKS